MPFFGSTGTATDTERRRRPPPFLDPLDEWLRFDEAAENPRIFFEALTAALYLPFCAALMLFHFLPISTKGTIRFLRLPS